MKEVTIEAEKLDDILWPAACVHCGQEEEPHNLDAKTCRSTGLWWSTSKVDFDIPICKRKQCRRYTWLTFVVISAIVLLMIGWIYGSIEMANPGYPDPHWSPIGGILIGLFLGYSLIYQTLKSGEKDCKCIRKSKTTWLFRFTNDLFADQFAAINDKDKRQQAEDQLRAEKRQQEEAEYEKERQRTEDENRRRFEQEKQEQEADNQQQTVKAERYYGKVLGLKGRITKEDVKRRYRQLCQQYHPDMVNHAGPKIKEVAEREMKKINEAYAYFEKMYGV